MQKKNKVSIIIPTYNCIDKVDKTIKSVLKQSYKNWEIIIVDGLSSDGTYEFINKNYAPFCTGISERDNGIYDAMNKGVKLAKGNWLYFLNAGDYLVNDDVLQNVAEFFHTNYTLVYGGYKIYFPGGDAKMILPRPLSDIPYDMPSCHQSLFYHCSLFEDTNYDTSHPWCADHIHLAELFRSGKLIEKIIDTPIAYFEAGGEVGRNPMDFINDRIKVAKTFLPYHLSLIYYFKMIWYNIIRKRIKRIFIPRNNA